MILLLYYLLLYYSCCARLRSFRKTKVCLCKRDLCRQVLLDQDDAATQRLVHHTNRVCFCIAGHVGVGSSTRFLRYEVQEREAGTYGTMTEYPCCPLRKR